MKDLEKDKFNERLDFAISTIKLKAEIEGIKFTEALFIEAIDTARTLFVRSEIAYSSNR